MTKNKVRLAFLIILLIGLIISINIPLFNEYKISSKSDKQIQSEILHSISRAQEDYITPPINLTFKLWNGAELYNVGSLEALMVEKENEYDYVDNLLKDQLKDGFVFDECLNSIFDTTILIDKITPKGKPFITPYGDQTKLINDVLFEGKTYSDYDDKFELFFTPYNTLDEDSDWFYFIARNYLSPSNPTENYLICAESKIHPVRYCLDGSNEYDYEKKIIKKVDLTERIYFQTYEEVELEWYQLGKILGYFRLGMRELKDVVILSLLFFAAFVILKAPKIFTTYINKNNSLGDRSLLKTIYTLVVLITISSSIWLYSSISNNKIKDLSSVLYDVKNNIESMQYGINSADRSLDGKIEPFIDYDGQFMDPPLILMEKSEFIDLYTKLINKNIIDIKSHISNTDTQILNNMISTLTSGNELSATQNVKLENLFEYYDQPRGDLRDIRNGSQLATVIFIYLLIVVLYTKYTPSIESNKKHIIYLRWFSVFSIVALFSLVILTLGSENHRSISTLGNVNSDNDKDISFSERVLLLANNPTLKNKKKIINLLNDSTIYSYSVIEELKKIVSHKKTITQSQLKRLKKVLEREKYIATRNREGIKKFGDFNQSVMFYAIAFIFFIISILVIIFELLAPYRNWLGISIDNKDKINQYFKWGGVFIVVTVITLILLVTLIKSNPGNYLILSEFLSPLTSTIDTFNMYYRSPEQGSKLQLLLLVPVVFSLVAIMVILYAKKQLTRYVIKLAQGEKVDPPRIRLQEFSQIVESIDTLQKRLKGKKYIETFISSIAHEVRTPLAGIRANTESLSLSMDSDNFGQAKDNIIESNNRMLLIIDSLLELAKLEQQNKTLEKTRCNINSIIENIINEPNIIKKLKDKNVSISFNKPNHCGADANKFLIEMCLLNMINNAIDFSLNNGIIWINATDNQNNISIEILDEGIGIPDNMLNKIQNKFVSTSRPYTNKRSTGLGLSLIKIIMDLHDGEFEISNRHDTKGVVAKLNFPKFRCQL